MNQVFRIALKDLKILSRDKLGAFFIVGFPILMGVFFGLVMRSTSSGSATSSMNVAFVDGDQSNMSQHFAQSLIDHDSLTVQSFDDLQAAKDAVRIGTHVAVIHLPAGFGETAGLFWETPPRIEIGADPSRGAETAMLQGFVMESIGQLAMVRFQDLDEMGRFVERSRKELANDPEIPAVDRMAISAFLGSIENLVGNIEQLPGPAGDGTGADAGPSGFQFADVQAIDISRQIDPDSQQGQLSKLNSPWDISFPQAMMWGVLGCVAGFSISIARERSEGTLTRLNIAPVSRFQVLLGKALACFLAVLAVVVMLTVLGRLLGMQPDSYPRLVLAAFSIAVCFVGLMMVISLLGKTEQSVSGAGWAINMIMAMLGGGMIPVMFMPNFLKTLSVVSPVRWSIVALEGAIWREFSLVEMLLPCGILVAIGSSGLLLGTWMLAAQESS